MSQSQVILMQKEGVHFENKQQKNTAPCQTVL